MKGHARFVTVCVSATHVKHSIATAASLHEIPHIWTARMTRADVERPDERNRGRRVNGTDATVSLAGYFWC